MNEIVKTLIGKIIVSCQAYQDTPLYGPEFMVAMAKCAEMGGASGIRACWRDDIEAIKSSVDLPIIGIHKIETDKNPLDTIIITPTLELASEIVEAGCDILAIDCTIRNSRNFDQLLDLLKSIKEKYPNIPIMADISTAEEAIKVWETGLVDIISTTLSGYTRESLKSNSEDSVDLEIIKEIKKKTTAVVNAEGRIWETKDIEKCIEAGADIITVGSAITRPHLITDRFVSTNNRIRSK